MSRDGLGKPEVLKEETEEDGKKPDIKGDEGKVKDKRARPKKEKKKKFRYESKLDRRITERKQKAKSRSKRPARPE